MRRRPPRVAGAARAPLHVLHSGDQRAQRVGRRERVDSAGSDHRRQLRDWRRFGRDTFHPNSVTYGAPCEVVREIGDKDREYFYKNRKLDVWE